jgi:uncharacterized protein YvpB
MLNLRRFTLFCVLVFLFFLAQEIQVNNDFFFLHAQNFSRVARRTYYMAAAAVPKENPTVLLGVNFHAQEHSLSCEIASLKMILDYRGLRVSESELLNLLPFSELEPRMYTSKPGGLDIWGDPDEGFVGNINGSMPKNTGYGVYEKPIRDLSQKWRKAEIITNEPLKRLITELNKGNPIVVWGAVGSGQDNSWQTPRGKFVKAIKGAHVRVVIGYVGPSDKPTQIILMDPLYREIRWSTKKFLDNWAKLENRAVVVY